jgi:hypothetical protein
MTIKLGDRSFALQPSALGCQAAHARRGATDCGEYRKAAGVGAPDDRSIHGDHLVPRFYSSRELTVTTSIMFKDFAKCIWHHAPPSASSLTTLYERARCVVRGRC